MKPPTKKLNKNQITILVIVTLFIISAAFFTHWLIEMNSFIDQQLVKKQFTPSIELYSAPEKFFKGQNLSIDQMASELLAHGYRERAVPQTLLAKDFEKFTRDECEGQISNDFNRETTECLALRNASNEYSIVAFENNGKNKEILEVYGGAPLAPIVLTELDPTVFAQYYGDEPILREKVELGDTPALCLNALLAIEDSTFLEHNGVNLKSIARALIKDLTVGRVVQGGSTITQQLVKNYFLTHEKTISRKFKEFFMAILLETKATKDSILEAYINEIYMGQNGPFQVHGFASGSQFYFGKKLSDLNLAECSMIAALVNGPGVFSPFTNPKKAMERRQRVLEKMVELKIISEGEANVAKQEPLPQKPQRLLSEPAPFFVDAVLKKVQSMGLDLNQGLKIETTLDLKAQEAAQKSVREGVARIESSYKSLKKLKESGKNLEALLVSADPTNGYIQAIVGGTNYKKSQFNRAVQSKRQVGSVMKPFVYLTTLENNDETGQPYTPLSILDDSKFTIDYDRQSWSPENYDDEYFGKVPMYYALMRSLNCATASLGIKIGLSKIVETAHTLGLDSDIKPFPAMTLGAFELSPLEVLQAYGTFARMGEQVHLTMIRKIKNLDNTVIYENTIERKTVYNPTSIAVLVGMMKQVMQNGTGRFTREWGFTHPAGGKTGTTSDTHDSWFAGFTPLHTAVVWVGYDDNTSHGLTGAQAAMPIWTQYMKDYAATYPPLDFHWPDSVELRDVSAQQQRDLGVPESEERPLTDIQLVFRK